MAPYLLLFFLFATLILVNMTRPRTMIGPRSSDRDAENAYNEAFKIVSKETVKRRRLVSVLLVIALLVDMLLLVWIFRFA
jgi:NADH:ubiquinone oxidoreductase subunit 3 (subunit A)